MSYRSSRYNINGYRSQPVSNRSSLYLNDYSTSSYGVSTDVSDFDRQFKRLLERTEKFTNRVERLQTTSSAVTKGFRYLDRSVTGRRDRTSLYDTLIDPDPVSTEEEWKRYLDRGCLVEKAVEQLRRQYRYPKPIFEYSPESRSPYSYNISPNTKLVSNPRTPTDRHGRRVRDKGMEQLEKNIVKDPSAVLLYNIDDDQSVSSPKEERKSEKAKTLDVLAEEDEPAPSPEKEKTTTNSIKNLRNEILSVQTNATKEEERNGHVPSKSIEKEANEEPKRKSSWRSRRGQQETTTEEKIKDDKEQSEKTKQTQEDEEPEKKVSKTHKLFDSLKNSSKKRNKNKGKDDSKKDKQEKNAEQTEKSEQQNNEANRREHVSGKARPTTMYDLDAQFDIDDEGNETKNIKKIDSNRNSLFLDDDALHKSKSSSSFHEYIPGHNVPLRERLRRKQQEQNHKPSSDNNNQFNSIIIPDRSLAQRASKIIRSKYHGNEKDEPTSPASSKGNSLTSKFFRRFMGGDKESEKEKAKDETRASVRKKRESENFENERNDEKSSPIQTSRSKEIDSKIISDESRVKHIGEATKETPKLTNKESHSESVTKTTIDNSQDNEPVVYRRKKNREKSKEDSKPVKEPPKKVPAVVEDEIVPTRKRAEELRLDFRSPTRSIDKVEEDIMEEETVRRSFYLNDDVFDCLQQLDALEEESVDSATSPDVPVQEPFEAAEESSTDLAHFIVPIEEENTLRMQQIDRMFDEIESINESMYQELLNLTKQEDDEDTENQDLITSSSQSRSLQYEPPQAKVPKMKILKSDLMGTERFVTTKEKWNTKASRTLSRTKSYDSGNDDRPGPSSQGHVRRNSESYDRPSSLIDINDDALKYVAKYTSTNIEELSGESPLPPPERNEDPSTSEKSERNISEVEKTREDVDKMLENCESIDKINNSMNETNKQDNTIQPRESSTIEEGSVHAEDMFGVDEIIETARQITALMEQAQVNNSTDDVLTLTLSNITNNELDTVDRIDSPLHQSNAELTNVTSNIDAQTISELKSDEIKAWHAPNFEALPGSTDVSSSTENTNATSTIHDKKEANATSSAPDQSVLPSAAGIDSTKIIDETLPNSNTTFDLLNENSMPTPPAPLVTENENIKPDAEQLNALNIQVETEQRLSDLPSPAKSEYATPPLTPSDICKTFPSAADSVKDENNNELSPTSEQKAEEPSAKVEIAGSQQEESTPELTASPFAFSMQRPKTNQQKRPSYLEKRQSHVGLFSLTNIPSAESSVNSPSLSDLRKSSSTLDVRQDTDSLFCLNRVASTTRLNTLESMKPDSGNSFKLVKVASSTRLSLLPTSDIVLSKKDENKSLDVADKESSVKETINTTDDKTNTMNDTSTTKNVKDTTKLLVESISSSSTAIPNIESKTEDTSKQKQFENKILVADNHEQKDIQSSEPLITATPNDGAPTVEQKQLSVESNTALANIVQNSETVQQSQLLPAIKSSTAESKSDVPGVERIQPGMHFHEKHSENVHVNGTSHENELEQDKSSSSKSSTSTLKAHSRNLSNGSTLSPPFSGSEDDNRIIKRDGRSVLEKQMSIKEYRLEKLKRGGTVETSFSDEDNKRSDMEFSTVSSLADISDASSDMNLSRNKRYSHSKKDLQNIGIESSSSESDVPLLKTPGQRVNDKLNMLHRINKANANKTDSTVKRTEEKVPRAVVKDYTRRWHSSGENVFDKSEKRKRFTKRSNFRSVDEF